MFKEKKEINFLESLKAKKITGSFAIISLISGFFFMGQRITGNVIFNTKSSLNLLPIIGVFLITCSIVLGAYSLKRR